jgi:hypothetical protein
MIWMGRLQERGVGENEMHSKKNRELCNRDGRSEDSVRAIKEDSGYGPGHSREHTALLRDIIAPFLLLSV